MNKLLAIIITTLAIATCGNTGNSISYIVMDHYFVNNDLGAAPCCVVRTQAEFDRLFGAAAVMGKDGEPTPVDFSKEYVIAVSLEPTDIATTIEPVSFEKNTDGKLVFTYSVKTGEKMSYNIQPCLLVKVANSNKGEVVIESQTTQN